jgi:hypothetical protein
VSDMVGSVGTVLDPWRGLIAAVDPSTGAPGGAADGADTDRDLGWQTTVGQIVFLESVVHEPT